LLIAYQRVTFLCRVSGLISNLISKVYFPRLIVPTATVIVAFVDFLITFAMLALLTAWYRFLRAGGCWSCRGSLC
jgi:ABC-type polysaccharide/polyol phosphate export permease